MRDTSRLSFLFLFSFLGGSGPHESGRDGERRPRHRPQTKPTRGTHGAAAAREAIPVLESVLRFAPAGRYEGKEGIGGGGRRRPVRERSAAARAHSRTAGSLGRGRWPSVFDLRPRSRRRRRRRRRRRQHGHQPRHELPGGWVGDAPSELGRGGGGGGRHGGHGPEVARQQGEQEGRLQGLEAAVRRVGVLAG